VTEEIKEWQKNDQEISFEEWILKEYWKYCDTIFDKKTFDKLSLQKLWDHAIEIIPKASLKDYKVYSLMTKKQQELNKFLEEHLKSERI